MVVVNYKAQLFLKVDLMSQVESVVSGKTYKRGLSLTCLRFSETSSRLFQGGGC